MIRKTARSVHGYYVYLHLRKDTGEVFYVGKGSANRAWVKITRGEHWKRVVAKHGYDVDIVEYGLLEWYAFELEVDLILKYKNTIINNTDGGEGASGRVITEEFRQSLRDRWADPEYKKRVGHAIHLANSTPEARKLRSEFLKEAFSNPELRKKLSEIQKIVNSRPEVRKKISEGMQRYLSLPNTRAEISLRSKEVGSRPEVRRKRAGIYKSKVRDIFSSPEVRAKCTQAIRDSVGRKVLCVETGVIFTTLTDAVNHLVKLGYAKAAPGNIVNVCKGLRNVAYGHTWKYADITYKDINEPTDYSTHRS